MVNLDPVSVLEQRLEFLQGLVEIATLCNWTEKEILDLTDYIHNELIRIDNLTFDVYEQSEDEDEAYSVWDSEMEDLRHWLSLVLGIKIRYV